MLFHYLLYYPHPTASTARWPCCPHIAVLLSHHHININIITNIHSQRDGHAAHTSLHLSTYVKALRSCSCSDSTSYGRPLMLPFRRLFFAFAAFAAFAAAALAVRFINIASVARRLLLLLPRGVAMPPVWCII